MNELKTKAGHTILKLNNKELKVFGREVSVCDNCCSILIKDGYYIPVLNRAYCFECYERWSKKAIYYSEDAHFENEKLSQILENLKRGV